MMSEFLAYQWELIQLTWLICSFISSLKWLVGQSATFIYKFIYKWIPIFRIPDGRLPQLKTVNFEFLGQINDVIFCKSAISQIVRIVILQFIIKFSSQSIPYCLKSLNAFTVKLRFLICNSLPIGVRFVVKMLMLTIILWLNTSALH